MASTSPTTSLDLVQATSSVKPEIAGYVTTEEHDRITTKLEEAEFQNGKLAIENLDLKRAVDAFVSDRDQEKILTDTKIAGLKQQLDEANNRTPRPTKTKRDTDTRPTLSRSPSLATLLSFGTSRPAPRSGSPLPKKRKAATHADENAESVLSPGFKGQGKEMAKTVSSSPQVIKSSGLRGLLSPTSKQ